MPFARSAYLTGSARFKDGLGTTSSGESGLGLMPGLGTYCRHKRLGMRWNCYSLLTQLLACTCVVTICISSADLPFLNPFAGSCQTIQPWKAIMILRSVLYYV